MVVLLPNDLRVRVRVRVWARVGVCVMVRVRVWARVRVRRKKALKKCTV